ncbi:hypothetical protein LIA77_11969 [Sarocladium implicatum]|nr:hypothetical protein LIA77_11969 [Sarocladium implicatum]
MRKKKVANIHCPIQLLDLMDRELLENPDDEADEYDSGLGSSSLQDILGGYTPWFGTGMDKGAGEIITAKQVLEAWKKADENIDQYYKFESDMFSQS